MPKMTDYVREGYNRRRRPWNHTELPEWWNLAVWAGVVGIVVVLLISAVFGPHGSSSDTASGDDAPPYPVQSLNPYRPDVSPSGSATPSGGNGDPSTDFAATAATQMPVTGGGTAVVPAGARNVSAAAATAKATGDWTGIPFIGADRPARASRTPQGSVVGQITVTDPAVTGTSQYLFSATITHGGGAKPYLVQIAVEHSPSGYAIRAR